MGTASRATIYLNPAVRRALRVKAAETGSTVSRLVEDAVRRSMAEDEADLRAFEERASQTTRPLEKVLKDLKRDGLL
jgi:hypothetical protein